ncbi:hypothetical protein N431DRAFT_497816 [Stipitochalara longipes BDJ]|nr:hypothetical protein N431DRAFT_497816 [Stipitochalara longipes BDJ]
MLLLLSKLVLLVKGFKFFALLQAATHLAKFALGLSSLGDFLCYLFQCLTIKSAVEGGLFAKDLHSTVTLLLYLYNCFSAPTFLILFSVQLAFSKSTRETYRFLLERGEKDDLFWRVIYAVAHLSAIFELEYAFWAENLYTTPFLMERWRLEKQPGYREKQTPEAIQKLRSVWRELTARVMGE